MVDNIIELIEIIKSDLGDEHDKLRKVVKLVNKFELNEDLVYNVVEKYGSLIFRDLFETQFCNVLDGKI